MSLQLSCPQQQQQEQNLKFSVLLQQPALRPVLDEQQLQELHQQGRAFAVTRASNINRDWVLQLKEQHECQQQNVQKETIPCPGGCGEAFCSAKCLQSDFIHHQLCVGRMNEGDALVAFKRFAVEHCENLLLVAAAIVSAATAAAASCNSTIAQGLGVNDADIVTGAMQLLRLLLEHQHELWQEEEKANTDLEHRPPATEEEIDDEATGERELSRAEIVERGAKLLLLGLQEASGVYAHLVSPSLVSKLLSLFEHCNSDLDTPNPLNSFFGFCSMLPSAKNSEDLRLLLVEKETVLAALFGEQNEGDTYNDEESDRDTQNTSELSACAAGAPAGAEAAGMQLHRLRQVYMQQQLSKLCPPPVGEGREFPAVKRTAFFCSVARVNHSCSPNMEMECAHTPSGSQMLLRTSRNVQQGEELCTSYIKDLTFLERKARRQRLEEFGFDCSCAHCAQGL
ncbi:histone-lysine N-methyltransferase, putative [Eimeria necatrix]|uniref:Histone-lysine N-methyltransferase, putative n=1 Tax=Eimeria necatrix TaxID=51315 RepID=U6MU05_9EIME|nr:histone-lysine N-methyltransferase, putative [Eimeria necatrix]CDJ67702.1 histone-lysine N-methyltransferase, putative [Eimeria necatrix]